MRWVRYSLGIKSWPCFLPGPLINSWLPPSMKLEAQFSENCAQRGFVLSKLSKHDSSASESAFPSILIVIRFPALFLHFKFDVSIQFYPPSRIPFSTANSTVLVHVTHYILSLINHEPIVDPIWSIVDLTCTHIFGWDNSWKASILDCNKILSQLRISNLTCPCNFILVLIFHLVLQVVRLFGSWDIVYYMRILI